MSPAKRVLFVVSPGRPDLIDLLHRKFADVADAVEIVPDRRAGERRHQHQAVGFERRVMERRRHDVEEDLRAMGWSLIRRG